MTAIDELVPLLVRQADLIAEGVFAFELRDPNGGDLPPFTAGAHVAVQVPGARLAHYSLCNDPAERHRYVLGVKRGGGASRALVDSVRTGDALMIGPPRNDFPLVPAANLLFLAGGIGITPIMSMIRHLQGTGHQGYRLCYCTRSPATTPFMADLSAPGLRERVTLHHDDGDPARAMDFWPLLEKPGGTLPGGTHVYCCGPRAMMEAVRDMTGHWPPSMVHFEDFGGAQAAHKASDEAFAVRLARTGERVEIPADASILEVLRGRGMQLAFSCESGSCGSCRTRLLAGNVEHRDFVLTEEERGDSIMICVSRSRSGELVLDL